MYFPTAGDVYRAVHQFLGPPHVAVVVRFFQVVGTTGVAPDEQQVADAIQSDVGTLWANLMTDTADYTGVSIQKILPAPELVAVLSSGAAVGGTAGPNGLPAQTSGVVTLQSALAGRANRGRIYVPFPDQADNVTAGQPIPTTGYEVRLGILAAHFINSTTLPTSGGTITIQHVIYHRKLKSITFITNARSNRKWGTQRRRGIYGTAHR